MTTEQALISQQYAEKFGTEVDWWLLCGQYGTIDKAMKAVKEMIASGRPMEYPEDYFDPNTNY